MRQAVVPPATGQAHEKDNPVFAVAIGGLLTYSMPGGACGGLSLRGKQRVSRRGAVGVSVTMAG